MIESPTILGQRFGFLLANCIINQSGDEFYGRVKIMLDELIRERNQRVEDRAATSLSVRYSTISAVVLKSVACHAKVVVFA